MYHWISPKAYRHHGRFRVVTKRLDGQRGYKSFETAEQAASFIEQTQSRVLTGGHRIDFVIDRYLASRKELKPSTLVTLGHRLRSIIRNRTRFPLEAFPWTDAWDEHVAGQSVDSQHGIHSALKGLLNWAGKVALLKRIPALPHPQGRKRRGKARLTTDETGLFVQQALKDNDPLAIAAATCVLTGLRPGEAMGLKVRDLDQGGALLHVAEDGGKTEAATRKLEVAEGWQHLLLSQAAGKTAQAFLFAWEPTCSRKTSDLGKARLDALRRRVKQLCATAGVRTSSPRGCEGPMPRSRSKQPKHHTQ